MTGPLRPGAGCSIVRPDRIVVAFSPENARNRRNSGGTMSAHEQMEHAEHAEHAAEHNKKIALLIAVLALFLAFSETLGKSAQTEGIGGNVEASNLWAFFQAKSIRRTVVLTAAEAMKLEVENASSDAAKAAMQKQIDDWQKTAARYRSEPETHEGTAELAERAKATEHTRDIALARYHNYEIASAAFQIAIVMASATIITGMIGLAWIAGLLGLAGIGFMGLALFAPETLHHLMGEATHHAALMCLPAKAGAAGACGA
jgi:hypothetical protein